VKSPFRYPGGKSKKSVKQRILERFPFSYDFYREPFCGGAGIFFSIPTTKSRWINDLDKDLISVYLALKNNPDDFIKKCREIKPQQKDEELTSTNPNGRKIYNKRLKEKFDELKLNEECDQALRYFFLNRVGWSGRVRYDLPSRLYFSNPSGWNVIKGNTLENAAIVLKDVKITCGDYSILLEEPGDNVFIYIDPPYVKNSKLQNTSQLYAHNFTIEDHIVLADKIKLCKHKCLISYDDDELIRKLYKDFNIYSENWTYCGTSLSKKETGKELLIANY
jgi:DNA adenine methylase